MTTTPTTLPSYARRILDLAADDPQLQELAPDEEVLRSITQPDQPLEAIIAAALDGYRGRPALGEREYEVVRDPSTGRRERRFLPRFTTVSYGELHRRVQGLASAWRHDERYRVDAGDFVCVLGFSGVDYVAVTLACVYARAVDVPLQSTLAGADLDGIFTDTAPTAVVATVADLPLAAELAVRHPSIRSIVAIEYDAGVDDDRERWATAEATLTQARATTQLVTLDDVIVAGASYSWEPLPPLERSDDRTATVMHSSGSTGTPKGAIFLERNARFQFTSMPPMPLPIVRLCFAPMNHSMGRATVFTTMMRGGTAYFTARPDMSTLFEDFRLVRPTEAAMFPRVLEMIHTRYITEVARRRDVGDPGDRAVGAAVMAEMRFTVLGDRIALITTGAAPTTPEVERFIKQCLPVTLVDGYGTTEAGGFVTMRNRIMRPPIIDYKLRDVPELGYFTTDRPYPRGELCVKTELSVPGYFKRPEATAALFDEDGYVRTGDIMEERGPDHVVYIDRRNDVLKLAQGEFVALGQLGNHYENGSDVILQMFMHGSSARSYLLAVIVPDMFVATQLLGPDPSPAELKDLIRSELKRVAEVERHRSFEVPRDFIIELTPFSHENGLLSSIHKRLRPNLQRRYGDALEQLYAELEQKQSEERLALFEWQPGTSVLDTVAKTLQVVLGLSDLDPAQPHTFSELGGDSLGATELAATLSEIFGVEVPINGILSPAGNTKEWTRQIEALLAEEEAGAPTFSKIHGRGARRLDARDLDISRFLGPDVLAQAAVDQAAADPRVVLVTGATGFLGRFLCLTWLERLASTEGKVVCLVRAPGHEAATRRLHDGFGGDPALERRFAELAADHLEVVVGDVAGARLGLDDETYDRLAQEVERIVHPAALVNHVLDYRDLFAPNVGGTAQLVGLALTCRQKPIDFVSSLAATWFLDRNGEVDEDAPLSQAVTLGEGYSAGYGASKWAAEQVLHSAHRRFGLPVNVFRGDMMLPHRRYHGQVNAPDIFVRLLSSLVATGLAPGSFYQPQADGSRPRAHYDGLPVDFIATAIVRISLEAHRDLRTMHVVNDHDDGISLDTFVDWIEAAGYDLERISPYGDWLERFTARLQAMPDAERQRSLLPVLDAYRRPIDPTRPAAGCAHFVDAWRAVAGAPEMPQLTQPFIDKCLDDLRRVGLISPPTARSAPGPGVPAGAPA